MGLIFFLALVLRLYQLNVLPSGFHVDEAKVGWNAYSLLKTGRDDWGHAFPLYYDTFGDFRPTGYFYAAAPVLALFGLTEFAVRLAPAVFGGLSVLVLFFLTLQLTKNKFAALLAAFFLAVSPWHIALSRASSEAIISLALSLLGLLFFIRGCQRRRLSTLILALLFLSLSYFFYHTFRLLTPPLVFLTLVYYSWPISLKKLYWPGVFILAVLSLLTLVFSLDPRSRARLSQISIFNDLNVHYELQKLPFEEGQNHVFVARLFHNKAVIYTSRFITEYAQYFSPGFLIGNWGSFPLRYVTVDMGPLTYIEFLCVIFGLVYFIRRQTNPLPLLFLLVAPLAAALTTEDAPNLSRSLFMVPVFCIFAAWGVVFIKHFSPRLVKLVLILLILNFIYFLHMYSVHNSQREEIAMNRNSGVTELISRISELQKTYSLVVLTNIPDSLYPWYAFILHLDPNTFNAVAKNRGSRVWQYQNVVFSQIKCPAQDFPMATASAVFVNAEGCTNHQPFTNKLEDITRSSGGVAYTIWGQP